MYDFKQRFSPARIAVFSLVSISLSGIGSSFDFDSSVSAQEPSREAAEEVNLGASPKNTESVTERFTEQIATKENATKEIAQIKTKNVELNSPKVEAQSSLSSSSSNLGANQEVQPSTKSPSRFATIFIAEIKEIQTTNLLPKLPPDSSAQASFIFKSDKTSPKSNQLKTNIQSAIAPKLVDRLLISNSSKTSPKTTKNSSAENKITATELKPEAAPIIKKSISKNVELISVNSESKSQSLNLEPSIAGGNLVKTSENSKIDSSISVQAAEVEVPQPKIVKSPEVSISNYNQVSQLPKLEPIKPELNKPEPAKVPEILKTEPLTPIPSQAPEVPKPNPVPDDIKVENTPKLEPFAPALIPITTPEVPPAVQRTEAKPEPTIVPVPAKTSEPSKPAANIPGTNSPKRVDATNSWVFDTGIRQTPSLSIPTIPSQIKIDRTQPISLQEALQIAETNSQTIKQAAIAVQRAKAVVDEAVAARNPNVDVEGRYSFSDSADARQANIARSPLFADNSTITQPLSGTVQLSYNVFTSGLNEAQIKAAEDRLRATEADLTRVRQTTFLDITNAYIDLQDTDETVRIRAASVNARQLSLKDTQSLERAGVGTKFDVLQSEVQLSNAQQQLLSAQNNQQIRRRTLAQQLQYSPTLNLSAADKIEPAADWKLTLEDTILQALRNRSELDIQKLTISAALNQAKAEIARLGPQVQLTASYDLRDNFSNVGGISMGYTLGARVSWRLFDGGVANARVRQFESDRDLAESRFDQSATQIRLEVESAYFTLDSTRDQIKTSAKAVLSAAEALRLARLRLTAGVGTQLEVIRAEEDLTQAEVNRSAAIIGFNRAVAALQRSLNTVAPR
jgi:outer membrane protein TolC